jgi:hypothetical protein
MKLIFFLVAFCLVSIRVYFSWSGMDKEKRGESVANFVISSDNFYEGIKYSGKFQLTDDETAFKSISPGGYLKFRKNEERVTAESNLQGEIEYTIYDGKNKLALDEQGRKLIAEAIREMINWGFDADARMERIYQKGGNRALLNEVDSMKTDPVKVLYLDRVFAVDSLSPEDLPELAKKIGTLGTDQDKTRLLNKFSPDQLKNPLIAQAYFTVVEGMGSDMEKINALQHMMDQDTIQDENADKILDIAGHMGSDLDKINLYKKLMEEKTISESQWINLLNQTVKLGSDMDKANLLVEIAQKMPRTENLKATYLTAAKAISDDSDYGKAVRAVE